MYDNVVRCLLDIPGFVVHDAFEQWVYSEAPDTVQPHDLDAKWRELSEQFLPDDDGRGQEAVWMTGWQRNTWSQFPHALLHDQLSSGIARRLPDMAEHPL